MPEQDPFTSINADDLTRVAGGSRVSARTGGNNDQLLQLLTQVTSSIKDLANTKAGGSDPMTMMMMMMMMGGMGGMGGRGSGGAAVAAPPPQEAAPLQVPPINIIIGG